MNAQLTINGMRILVATIVASALCGIAMATIPDSTGVIHGCYTKPTSTIRIIDSTVSTCKSGETALNWSVTGPAGPMGPVGPAGPTGPAGASGPPGPTASASAHSVTSTELPISDGAVLSLNSNNSRSVGDGVITTTFPSRIMATATGQVLAQLDAIGQCQLELLPSGTMTPTQLGTSFVTLSPPAIS